MSKNEPIIASKLPKVGASIFSKMSGLAIDHNALNLSQGFPDFGVDEKLIAMVYKAMKEGFNQYAPMPGNAYLREVLTAKINRLYNANYDANEEITITAGGTQAIYTAISAFVKEDDEVIIFTPAYDSYDPAITLHGGKTKYVALKLPDYKIDWNEVKKLVNHKTRMIIINTPHNPSGSLLSSADIKELEKLVLGSDIIVLSDEVYEHIIFDGQQHESICKYPNLKANALAVFSFGKTLHVTGWKMGYIVGAERLMKEFRKVHQYTVFSCNHPLQVAIANYLENEETYLGLPNFYQQKRDLFLHAIKGSNFDPIPCKGTYFQLLSYKRISDEKDTLFAEKLTKEFKIAAIPISVFYNTQMDEKVLRFCFAKNDETLVRAGEILKSIH
jgi:methionine aminotransferase